MNNPADIQYCPARANIAWNTIQFSPRSNRVQVADYSKVKYFEPSDSSGDESDGEGDGMLLSDFGTRSSQKLTRDIGDAEKKDGDVKNGEKNGPKPGPSSAAP